VVRQSLGFPVGARISWSNRLVDVASSVVSFPVGARTRCCIVQLELDIPYCVVQLELNVHLVNRIIKA
jgi:hypothetical protein